MASSGPSQEIQADGEIPAGSAATCALAGDQMQSLSVIGMQTRRVPCRIFASGTQGAPVRHVHADAPVPGDLQAEGHSRRGRGCFPRVAAIHAYGLATRSLRVRPAHLGRYRSFRRIVSEVIKEYRR